MTPEGRKIWDSKEGVELLSKMFNKEPLTPKDKATVEKLKMSGAAKGKGLPPLHRNPA